MATRRQRHRHGLIAVMSGAASLLLLTSCYLWLLGTPRPTDAVGGPFQLVASDGRTVDERSFPGRFMLLYFGYTHCRDVCPTTLTALAGALDALGQKATRIQPLFVTLDPGRDTPQVLQTYLVAFTPRLLGLTGTQSQLDAVAHAYRVTSLVHPAAAGGYDIDHSSVLYLMSADGRFLTPIRADAPAAEMTTKLAEQLS